MRTRRSLLAVGLVTCLALTACSSEDEPTETASDTPTLPESTEGEGDAAGESSQLAAVALFFDGERVPTSEVCNGVDGAVRATTPGEVTIFLVREEGTTMRYLAEGMEAESADVSLEEIGESRIYTTVFEDEDVPRIEVTMEVNDTSVLADCA